MTLPSLQFAQILCPTEFSVFSAGAFRHALALAQQFRARVHVVHAIPSVLNTGGTAFFATHILPTTEQLHHADLEMARFVALAGGSDVEVTTEIRVGEAWREVLTVARELPADLVTLSSHGRTGLERSALGRVTSKLLGQLPCPTMTVGQDEGRAGHALSAKRILCATDFSPSATEAVAFAIALADHGQARVTLLHVVEDSVVDPEKHFYYSVPETAPLRHALEEQARPRLLAAAPDVLTCGVEVEKRLSTGRADQRILELAARQGADLIVLGTRGHGRLSRILLGSTSERVVREATCPVVTVPPLATARVLRHEVSLAGGNSGVR